MKDKTNLKIIVAVIVSVIISSGITAFAAIKFQANEIGYNTTSVADALDSLYQTQFSNNYSTEEKVIGKWIDGKPLYQKTINLGNLPNKATKTVNHEIENIDLTSVMYESNLYYATDDYATSLPRVNDSRLASQIFFEITSSSIIIYGRGENFSAFSGHITLKYTKTIDQPISN